METLKKIFPLSFGASDVSKLIIICLVYLVIGAVLGFVISILARIPVIGLIFSLIASLLELYLLFGLVILFLDYFKVLK